MEDNHKHKGLRNKLINTIRDRGISDERVLSVMAKIPRHWFISDNIFLNYAYEDIAFPIGMDQTISQPYTVGFQTSLLNIKRGDKILEIGTGSGYQTAVLVKMGAKVFTIERQKNLFDKTKKLLPKIGYRAKFVYGDGYKGLPQEAPYDKIIVTAGAPYVPDPLKTQLKIGGTLVIPVGEGDTQKMYSIKRISDVDYETIGYEEFRFVPLLNNKQF